MKPTYLYIKQHLITGLKYFGKTTQDPYKYLGSGTRWIRHIKKYGKDKVITCMVYGPFTDEESITKFALDFSQMNDIVNSNKWANLINENGLDGGDTGPRSEETRKKMSEAKKGIPKTEEHRRKMSEARQNISEETRRKLSEAQKGKTLSEEIRKKMSDAKKGNQYSKGRILSEEARRKIGEAKKGKSTWNKGRSHSEDHRRKISEALKKKKEKGA